MSRTNIEVNKFSPICKLNATPIQFIAVIINPPSKEFIISLIISFIGKINIFPNTSIDNTQAKKIIIVLVLFISLSSTNNIIMLVLF